MKAYNPQWAENDFIQNVAQKWLKQGFLSKEQSSEIKKVYPTDYYSPNIFLKIALFIFSILGASFSGSVLSLLFIDLYDNYFNIAIILESVALGIIFVFILETIIKKQKHYRSGVDNALIYMALGAFSTTIYTMFEKMNLPTWAFLLFFLPPFIVAIFRYADSLVAGLTYFLAISIVTLLSLTTFWGKTLLPFIIMTFSVGMYFLAKKMSQRNDYLYYRNCTDILKIFSLVTLYLGGNYLIVREGNAQINHLSTSIQVSFAPLFYIFTAIIPLTYIVLGLLNKDRLLLIIGFLTLGFSIFTYRFYFSILPIEIALTLGGTILIMLAGGFMHYLRTPKHGFTNAPDESGNANLESMLMSQMIQSKIPQQGDTFRFGGGDSGGGGAGGEY